MECKNCGEVDGEKFGLVPNRLLVEQNEDASWTRVQACPHCGALKTYPPTNEELNRAADKIEDFYVENDLA